MLPLPCCSLPITASGHNRPGRGRANCPMQTHGERPGLEQGRPCEYLQLWAPDFAETTAFFGRRLIQLNSFPVRLYVCIGQCIYLPRTALPIKGKIRRHSGAPPPAANPEPIFQRPLCMDSGLPRFAQPPERQFSGKAPPHAGERPQSARWRDHERI